MACSIDPNNSQLLWMIQQIQNGDQTRQVVVECEEYEDENNFEAKLLSRNDEWNATCDGEDCYALYRNNSGGGGCSCEEQSASKPSDLFRHITARTDAGTGGAGGAGGQGGASGADGGDATASEIGFIDVGTTDAALDATLVDAERDAGLDAEPADAITPDAAPVEPDAEEVPVPPVDLEMLTFGLDPFRDCSADGAISACLTIGSEQALTGEALFYPELDENNQPLPIVIQVDRQGGTDIPSSVDTFDQRERIQLQYLSSSSNIATWSIVRRTEFQNPDRVREDPIGELLATFGIMCTPEGVCGEDYIIDLNFFEGGLTCVWTSPMPDNSPCVGGR